MKKLLIFFAMLWALYTLSLIANDAQAQQSGKQYHEKLQKERSYEARIKSNKAFTLASAKYALKDEKRKAREARRLAREVAKREKIYARINALKND